jgi:hypothetical protein
MLRPGDIIEARVRGVIFSAAVQDIEGRDLTVQPLAPWATWRKIRLGQVVRRVDPPLRKHRRAAA